MTPAVPDGEIFALMISGDQGAEACGITETRAIVMEQKTGRPVQFELLADARASLLVWLDRWGDTVDDYVFPSRVDHNGHLSTRQYARLVDEWVRGVGLMRSEYSVQKTQC